tara:strand:- start:13 stop:474 length:462 start_codon:yes stop_codon:yes gene_type:complete
MNETQPLVTNENTGNKIIEKITTFLENFKNRVINFFKELSEGIKNNPERFFVALFLILLFLMFYFRSESFTNEIEQVTQEPEEPCHDGTDSNLINTPLCSEKTYQNTSLENTAPSEFEVLKNFDILETNNIISVKERIDGYIDQPTFLPGKFN